MDCSDPDCNGDPACDCDITPPVADFSCEPNSGDAPLTVNFTNNSSGDDLCIWDFGDGTTIVLGCEDQEHTFTQEGSYDVTLTVAGVGGIDTAECTITVDGTSPEEDILEKYAPILYMHPDERYHPTDVMNMLKNSRLYERRDWKKDKPVDRTPTLHELVNNFDEDKYYLRLKYNEKKLKKRNWEKDQTVYGRQFTTYEGGTERTVLQYWFFYVYNDWDDDHEGDWEMIQIVFGSNNEPLLITYSIHKGGMTLPWDDPKVSKNGDHPKVYVNLGGHGSWNEPGNHTWYQSFTGIECDQCIDEASDQGDVIAPEGIFNFLPQRESWA